MSDQIDHSSKCPCAQNIRVRIVPAGIGYHPGLIGPFDIYEFDESRPIDWVEHVYSTAFLHETDQISDHRQVAKLLSGQP